MSNRALVVAFGLAISMASTLGGYCAYETSQLVRKAYFADSQAAESTEGADFARSGTQLKL